MTIAMQPIYTQTVGAGGAATVTFNSIPQTFTDLKVVASMRDTGGGPHIVLAFNGSGANFSNTLLLGDGASTYSQRRTDAIFTFTNDGSGNTANTFASLDMYLPNYTLANFKQFTLEAATENNAAGTYTSIYAGLRSNTAAVTSISFTAGTTAFAQYSTFSLYGITKG
jgi:hypothetical protein